MSFSAKPKRKRADGCRTRETMFTNRSRGLRHSYPGDPERVMSLAGSTSLRRRLQEGDGGPARQEADAGPPRARALRRLAPGGRYCRRGPHQRRRHQEAVGVCYIGQPAGGGPGDGAERARQALRHQRRRRGRQDRRLPGRRPAGPPHKRIEAASSRRRSRTGAPSVRPMSNLPRVRLRLPSATGTPSPSDVPADDTGAGRLPRFHSVPAPRIRPSPKQGLRSPGPPSQRPRQPEVASPIRTAWRLI